MTSHPMTQVDLLFQAILDDPDDDDVRLVYADYLEEHGERQRADFIRVQIELALLPEGELTGEQLAKAQGKFKGKTLPLLSWRVAILPYIEQTNLYNQFQPDEPWDSGPGRV
jgi:uncharacterized protein (TIGR02996 family)